MVVLLSSDYLKKKIEELNGNVRYVSFINGKMNISSDNKTISLDVVKSVRDDELSKRIEKIKDNVELEFKQLKTKWDHVYDLVSRVSDQPIMLDINDNKVNVIFEY